MVDRQRHADYQVISLQTSDHFCGFLLAGQVRSHACRSCYILLEYSTQNGGRSIAKTTSFNLGDHFEQFISAQVQSDRFGNTSEVLRASLRLMEQEEQKLSVLRQVLIDSENSGDAGELDREKIQRNTKKKAGFSR